LTQRRFVTTILIKVVQLDQTASDYRRKGLGPTPTDFLKATFEDFHQLAEQVSKLISERKIVGWLQGRFENRLRALGNCSILCEPSNLSVTRRQTACEVDPSYASNLRATLHVDGTSRLQVCDEIDNFRFNRLLRLHEKRTGFGALLKTSFNEKGFPIVNSAVNALLMFARTDMDVLEFDNVLLRKA
jgi:carbamoyltransferase